MLEIIKKALTIKLLAIGVKLAGEEVDAHFFLRGTASKR